MCFEIFKIDFGGKGYPKLRCCQFYLSYIAKIYMFNWEKPSIKSSQLTVQRINLHFVIFHATGWCIFRCINKPFQRNFYCVQRNDTSHHKCRWFVFYMTNIIRRCEKYRLAPLCLHMVSDNKVFDQCQWVYV